MKDQISENNYKSILKSTGIFGFAQLLKIVVSVLSSKFVAIFLGPVGIGIVGLINNTINIISSFTNFGFNITSIREISLANTESDANILQRKIAILQKMAILIGLFGVVVTLVFSPIFSIVTFGTTSKSYWFVFLSVNFLILSLTNFRIAIIQGTRQIKQLAISNVVTSIVISLITIPIYFFFRQDGIIPVLLISSVIGYLVNYYYSKQIIKIKIDTTFSESFSEGKDILKLGFLLSINVIFGYLCTYFIKIYLNANGTSTEILGLYEVSSVFLLSYVGLIFNSMASDYYPRLTSIHNEINKVNSLVNNQIEIALLLITPAILLLYFLSPIVIEFLYSKEFFGVLDIFKAALFAVIIKAIIWPLSFVILAKGDKKQYFKQELFGDFMNITFTILFYNFFGLIGIGVSTLLNYSIFMIYIFTILKRKYAFILVSDTKKTIYFSIFLGALALLTVFYFDYPTAYYPLGLLSLLSILYSYKGLDKRLNLKELFLKYKMKFIKNK